MTSEELLRGVASALEAAGVGNVTARRLSALDGAEGCAVRLLAARVATLYINGDAEVEQQVRAICKRRRALDAMADAEAAADAMDGLVVEAPGGPAVLSCDGDAYQELELNDQEYTVWEARATARYTRKGDAR